MQHEIECAQNAIQCAIENMRDAQIECDTKRIYEIANDYIETSLITCNCVETRKTRIIDELREINIHAQYRNFDYTIESIDNETFHIVVKFDIDYETHFDSMIVKYNDVYAFRRAFRYFDIVNEINI